MDEIDQLAHLSLVKKVITELYNHTGMGEKVMGKFLFFLFIVYD
jgi:hypothetical protein